MQIDRRKFLRLFSAAALASIAPIEQLVAFERSRFRSDALKFSFEIPAGWHRPTLEEVRQNLQKQTFTDDERISEVSATPLVAIYRHKEPHLGMNAGMWVYADKYEAWMGPPCELASNYIHHMSSIVEDARTQTPTEILVGGLQGAKTTLAYRLIVEADNFEHEVVDSSRLVYHRGHIIWFLFEQSLNGPERAEAEFDLIERSISFA